VNDPAAGPWVLVVGMHRSGTSAVAGALGALGFNLNRAEDRMDWPESNPEHWESLSLGLHDEGLLARLGGGWDAPPDFPPGWEHSPTIAEAGDPAAVLSAAYPEAGPSVWKDPRLCLLLPYWRGVLPDPVAAVFVWRSPLAVARSLHRRDGLPLLEGIALWERYNRSAVLGLQGVDTYVLDYQSVVDEPDRFVKDLVTWLGSLAPFEDHASGWDLGRAAAAITGGPHHPPDARPAVEDPALEGEQGDLVELLSGLSGGQRSLEVELPSPESVWTEAVIGLRRTLVALREELKATKELLRIARVETDTVQSSLDDAKGYIATLHASTSWRITKPVRTLTETLERSRHHSGTS
jgi:hypothetical protein